jgi:hypothetical protein
MPEMAALPAFPACRFLLPSIVICTLITQSYFVHLKVTSLGSMCFILPLSNAKFLKKYFHFPYTVFPKYFLFINAREIVFLKEIKLHRT